jgi:hypothetical protein
LAASPPPLPTTGDRECCAPAHFLMEGLHALDTAARPEKHPISKLGYVNYGSFKYLGFFGLVYLGCRSRTSLIP